MRHLLAMDLSQCVTCWLWTEINASPVGYGHKSMGHLLVMDVSHASPVGHGRKSMRLLLVMDISECVTCWLGT